MRKKFPNLDYDPVFFPRVWELGDWEEEREMERMHGSEENGMGRKVEMLPSGH